MPGGVLFFWRADRKTLDLSVYPRAGNTAYGERPGAGKGPRCRNCASSRSARTAVTLSSRSPGGAARYILPIDERLRAVALGQTSRLAQYEIEVESPLRPKEIQARIRAGETAEEIADAAGIPVERVRWFEGPVLGERAYIADQAQAGLGAAGRRLFGAWPPAWRHRHRPADGRGRRPGGRAVGLTQARRRQLAGLADVPVRRDGCTSRNGSSIPRRRHVHAR